MKIKKLNDLEYALHFDNVMQAKKLFHYLYKASVYRCNVTEEVDCPFCELNKDCCEYWELIDALSEIAE